MVVTFSILLGNLLTPLDTLTSFETIVETSLVHFSTTAKHELLFSHFSSQLPYRSS